jgi:hypothetical protein
VLRWLWFRWFSFWIGMAYGSTRRLSFVWSGTTFEGEVCPIGETTGRGTSIQAAQLLLDLRLLRFHVGGW